MAFPKYWTEVHRHLYRKYRGKSKDFLWQEMFRYEKKADDRIRALPEKDIETIIEVVKHIIKEIDDEERRARDKAAKNKDPKTS